MRLQVMFKYRNEIHVKLLLGSKLSNRDDELIRALIAGNINTFIDYFNKIRYRNHYKAVFCKSIEMLKKSNNKLLSELVRKLQHHNRVKKIIKLCV
jgi:hypothetical protein